MWLIKDWELNEEARHPGELAERIRSREYLEDLK